MFMFTISDTLYIQWLLYKSHTRQYCLMLNYTQESEEDWVITFHMRLGRNCGIVASAKKVSFSAFS